MAKKYLGLEEAAEMLGIQPDELVRLRETQKVRGFADRGTWKFKTDDLEELSRSLQVDSNPDVPIIPTPPLDGASASVLGSEEDAVGEQSTTIRGGRDSDAPLLDGTSDSDVRLILDDGLDAADSEPDMPLPADFDSDSDVQLFDDSSTALELGSDSDVALVGGDSESDVRLAPVPSTDPGSDSDVRLVKEESIELSSDSDVKLVGGSAPDLTGSDSDVAIVPSEGDGSSLVLGGDDDDDDGTASFLLEDDGDESGIQLSAESGISLENLDDSGISLEAESGLTLAGDDSGLSILDADSGLTLESDSSGISMDPESGISLEPTSGISLEAGSDIALEGEMDETIPMLNAPSLESGDKDTELEIPSLGSDEDSEFELSLDDAGMDSSGDSSVLLFDDEDDDPDEHSATVVKKSSDMEEDIEGETFDLTADADDEFDLDEDEFDEDDDLDITDDVIGEDDELDDLDVFDADDDVFDEALDSGESHAEFAPPAGMGRTEVAAPEAEWGGVTFMGLLISTGLMAVCTMLMFDLVRGMWSWNEPSTFNSAILDALSGLFG